MDSIGTFADSRITPREVQTVFERVLETTPVRVEEIKDGVNTSCFLRTDSTDYFVKFSTFHNPEKQFKGQPFILQYLTQNTDIRVPVPVAYDYTEEPLPYCWYATRAEHGESHYTNDEVIPRDAARTVGRLLGRINSIQTPRAGFTSMPDSEPPRGQTINACLPFQRDDQWSTAFKQYMKEHITTMAPRFYDLRDELLAAVDEYTLREVTPQLLHCDYWWENLLWDSHDDPIVIDWEQAVGGDPLFNQLLSEHYLFDRVAVETQAEPSSMNTNQSIEHLSTEFRDAYNESYTGSTSLTAPSETRALYELFTYVRELRGFPYWFRHRSEDWKDDREAMLRTCINNYI